MNITKQTIVGELVAQDYRTAAVFKNQGIDFCCNGNLSIQAACEKRHLDSSAVIRELIQITTAQADSNVDYQSWPIDLLADYIEKKHHRYVAKRIGEITPFLSKVAKVHGGHHPELLEVECLFAGSASELSEHMQKEELILFPYIRRMQAGDKGNTPFGKVQNPISIMMNEHDNEGERFRRIAALTNDYTPPADACSTYRVTLSMLKEFEEDLHLHIHLENNILFPKAIELESSNANNA